jgi:hypothetical protein
MPETDPKRRIVFGIEHVAKWKKILSTEGEEAAKEYLERIAQEMQAKQHPKSRGDHAGN